MSINGEAKYKVPGGKLICAKLKYGEYIENVEILGDFFLYPEELLNKIEESIVNTKADSSEEEITKKIKTAIDKNKIEIIGITPESIAKTIKMALIK